MSVELASQILKDFFSIPRSQQRAIAARYGVERQLDMPETDIEFGGRALLTAAGMGKLDEMRELINAAKPRV